MTAVEMKSPNGSKCWTNIRKHVAPNKKALDSILKGFKKDGYKILSIKTVPANVVSTTKAAGKSRRVLGSVSPLARRKIMYDWRKDKLNYLSISIDDAEHF